MVDFTPEPFYSAATEEMWARLPEHFRRMDALNGWPMKKYISLMGDQLQEIDDLVDDIDFTPLDDEGEPGDTSAMVDPNVAPARWLPWLAQLFGLRIAGTGTEQNRSEVVAAAAGFNAGTKEAVAAAAKSTLVGERYAAVYPRSNSTAIGAGDEWDLLLVTRASETLINLYPLIQATIAELGTWTVATSPTATVAQSAVRVPLDKMVYNNAAMKLENTSGPSTTLTMNSTFKVGVTATDSYQTMLTLWTDGAPLTGTLGIKYYNTGGTVISTTSTAISISSTPTQFNYTFVAPATSTHMTTFFTASSMAQDKVVYAAQLGARHEVATQWIPETADPVATVIEKGAKPAGFKLWYGASTSDWDTIVSEFPTWGDVEGHSWEDLEESGGV